MIIQHHNTTKPVWEEEVKATEKKQERAKNKNQNPIVIPPIHIAEYGTSQKHDGFIVSQYGNLIMSIYTYFHEEWRQNRRIRLHHANE